MNSGVMAVITARGGSKGLPQKNIRQVNGMPLLAWTIKAASEAACVQRTILSSDDIAIIDTAKQYGCEVPFVRPPELALDTTPSIDVLLHLLGSVKAQYIILLQPTSPLRLASDIDGCFNQMMQAKAPACISITEVEQSPYWMCTRTEAGHISPLIKSAVNTSRRQDLPTVYIPNGSVYIAEVEWFLRQRSFIGPETIGYIMPQERSADIDTQTDLELCEQLMRKQPEYYQPMLPSATL